MDEEDHVHAAIAVYGAAIRALFETHSDKAALRARFMTFASAMQVNAARDASPVARESVRDIYENLLLALAD